MSRTLRISFFRAFETLPRSSPQFRTGGARIPATFPLKKGTALFEYGEALLCGDNGVSVTSQGLHNEDRYRDKLVVGTEFAGSDEFAHVRNMSLTGSGSGQLSQIENQDGCPLEFLEVR